MNERCPTTPEEAQVWLDEVIYNLRSSGMDGSADKLVLVARFYEREMATR